MRITTVFLILASLGSAAAQMVSPSIDVPGKPFSYAAMPTDVIGIPDALAATEITPEGYLYTGFGELMFLIGYPVTPASQRLRTLEKGYLPVIHYEYTDGPVVFHITAFSSSLRGDAVTGQFPVNFIRVIARNTSAVTRTSYFSAAFRYSGGVMNSQGVGDHRYRRPIRTTQPGRGEQPGAEFNPDWVYGFRGDCATRSGETVYVFPTAPKPVLWLTKTEVYTAERKTRVQASTPVLMAQYALHLPAGKSEALVFKMPVKPIAAEDSTRINELRAASFDEYLRDTVRFWDRELARGIQIGLGEEKVVDTFKSNLIYEIIARDRVGDDYIQTVNKFHYHSFYLRDGAYIVRGYDLAGYHDLACQCLEFFFPFQQPDGNFVSQRGQYDGWGQAMWAFGQHYLLTRDRGFAERAWPAVRKAVTWLREARRSDPLRLMPATNPGDAEFTKVAAHISGYNLWALAGLKNAIAIAHAVGADTDVREFQREYDDYARTLWKKLDEVTANTDGYIPPGIDQPGGQDWGNMLTLYPEQLLPRFDRKVTGTLNGTRAKYAEGLMTYAGRLHHYLTMKNTETLTVRGEQRKALEELYALLVHTSSTHAGWEFGVRAWGDRDFGQNLAPHGWFGAKYIAVIRNFLLREEGDDLHLLSVLSPAWTAAGQVVGVRNAPSYFGHVAFQARFQDNGMSMELEPAFKSAPRRIVVHLPWYVKVATARVDGQTAPVKGGALEAPASARKIEVEWARQGDVAGLSYREAVASYQKEYRARYQKFLREGSAAAAPLVTN